jgi:hypothetical protein
MTRYKRKSRSCEAAKTKNISLVPIITRNDADYSYIFSKRVDKLIDSLCPWILGLTALYFAGQMAEGKATAYHCRNVYYSRCSGYK